MRIQGSSAAIAVFFTLVLSSCGYTRKTDAYSAAPGVQPTFSSIYANIIAPKCIGCHGLGGQRSLTGYAQVSRDVRTGSPTGSRLYTEVESGSMPPLAPMLSDDEILAIYQWIAQGAPND